MSESNISTQRVTDVEFAVMLGRPASRIMFALLVVIGIGIYLGLRDGWSGRPGFLLLSAGLAGWATFKFSRLVSEHATAGKPARSAGNAITAFGGFLPYLLGLYLFFYEGLWGTLSLFSSFSFTYLLSRLAFIYIGYQLVKWTDRLSGIPGMLKEGRLKVVNEAIDQAA